MPRESTKIEFKCTHCQSSFYRSPSEIKAGKTKYCSVKCRGLSKRKRIFVDCGYCGKSVEKFPSGYQAEVDYCSHECQAKDRVNRIRKPPIFEGNKVLIDVGDDLRAIVDRSDWDNDEFIRNTSWRAIWVDDSQTYYVRCASCQLHRRILQTPPELEVNHMDFNGLNNSRENIHNCDSSFNKQWSIDHGRGRWSKGRSLARWND